MLQPESSDFAKGAIFWTALYRVFLQAKRDIRPLPKPSQNRQRPRRLSKLEYRDRTIRPRRRRYRRARAARRAELHMHRILLRMRISNHTHILERPAALCKLEPDAPRETFCAAAL